MYIVDGFKSSMGKFLDERMQWESLTALQANADDVVMPNGFKVFCNTENAWYRLACTNCYDLSTYVWTLAEAPEGSLQTKMQFTTMPTASSEYVGKVFEYIGETDATFTHGYFYEVAGDLDNPGSYMWTNVEVQAKYGQIIQYSVMPDVTELPMGSIIQFVGTATGAFIPGYFYTNEEVNYSITFADGVTPFATIASIYKLKKAGLNTADSIVIYVDADNNWKIEDTVVDLEEIGIKLDKSYEPVDGDTFTITYVTPGVVSWINQPVQPSSGGGEAEEATFTSEFATTINIAGTGITTQTKWPQGTPIETFLRDAFCPPTPPVFTASVTPAEGFKDKNEPINSLDFTINVTSFGSVDANSIKVKVSVGMTVVGEHDVTEPGTITITETTPLTVSKTYMVELSWLNKPTDTTRMTQTLSFKFDVVSPSYYGIVDVAPEAVDETIIKSLNKTVIEDVNFTYNSVVMSNQRICYVTRYGAGLKKIKDGNGFDITNAFTITQVEMDGDTYNVITLTNTGTYPASAPGTIIFSS